MVRYMEELFLTYQRRNLRRQAWLKRSSGQEYWIPNIILQYFAKYRSWSLYQKLIYLYLPMNV